MSGGLVTASVATVCAAVREGSPLCIEETIALRSAGADLQEKLGCSQGNMVDDAFVSEQPPTVEAIAARGATALKHNAPNRYRSIRLRTTMLVDFRFIDVPLCSRVL